MAVGLFTRWLHRWALLIGWAVAMVYGTVQAYRQSSPTVHHFAQSTAPIPLFGQTAYIGLTALVINVVTAVVVTAVLRLAAKDSAGTDQTQPADYTADAGQIPDGPGPALAD